MSQPDPRLTTGLIHHPYEAPAGFAAVPVAVHKASTIVFPNVAAMRARDWKHKTGYTYGLHGTPTSFVLEERIATLEGAKHCVLAPSGLAAIMVVNVALLKSGDHLVLPDNVYGPSKEMARTLLADWGITHTLYDPMDVQSLSAAITPQTRLVWLEAPGSVSMEFPDLRALVQAARERGVTTALDNTWGAGVAFNAFDLGQGLAVDISMHALTKYPSGGADVLMGAVCTVDEALHQKMLLTHMRLGIGVGANDVETLLRALPTTQLRYEAHDRSARELAAWLGQQPRVAQVLHPALPGAPGHAHWASHCRAAAGLFSVMLDEALTPAQVDAFCDALTLFKLGYSWGGPASLVVPYQLGSMRAQPQSLRGHLVRFSIGLERVDDLKADLVQALERLA
ncbi:cystathionine beta-lyase/cystathionine gamma-synthase [Burkholderiales bacterium JOSHI_001]|nr:cystathionine beta-lyase/cystathionine gamma-synthase [Burkholderiales bacterium JOSHI_001]